MEFRASSSVSLGAYAWSLGQDSRKRGASVEDKAKEDFVARLCIAGMLGTVAVAGFANLVPVLTGGTVNPITNVKLGALAALLTLGMLHQRIWGLTLMFKLTFATGMFCAGTFISIASRPLDSWHMFAVLMFDFVAVMQSDEDELALHVLSVALFVGYVVYVFLHTCSVDGIGPQIHVFDYSDDFDLGSQLVCNIVPVLLNLLLIMSYSRDQRRESKRARTSVELASKVAKALNDFDLEGAQSLLQGRPECQELPVCTQLWQLVHNLQVYRPFLPNYLFPHNMGSDSDPTHGAVSQAMWGKPTSWGNAELAAMRLRDPEYSLHDFHSDVEAAFPELQLYSEESRFSSGRTNYEEYQRTLGALYSVYCIARLDMDGKEIFSFGVDPEGKPVGATAACGRDPDDKRYQFYKSMEWDRMLDLFVRAGLLRRRGDNSLSKGLASQSRPDSKEVVLTSLGQQRPESKEMVSTPSNFSLSENPSLTSPRKASTRIRVDVERMTAFLALTAFHDVMKNPSLLPTVNEEHAPYQGIAKGDQINDHDIALMYIMEHFPGLLPSFHGLGPAQRAVVFFTQGKMGFNNGWLVQGEAPPGALFSKFKHVITVGGASESDISFYFSHWLTDLAGAEPFGGRPWPGSEKFAIKFPLKILNAFLDSFTYVHQLSFFSEVQVMEDYLRGRWLALGLTSDAAVEGCAVAAMRLALMAQGFEIAAVAALEGMPPQDRDVLATELARTGLQPQFRCAPVEVRERPAGPALLVYYAPALIQTAGAAHVGGALLVLAALCRAAREVFPLEATPQATVSTVAIRVDALRALTPPEIGAGGPWILQRTSPVDAVVAARREPGESHDVGARAVPIELPDL